MGFDASRFMKEKFLHRIEDVPVPDLKDFFPEGEEPVWKVRGLTGQEMGRMMEAPSRVKNYAALLERLASKSPEGGGGGPEVHPGHRRVGDRGHGQEDRPSGLREPGSSVRSGDGCEGVRGLPDRVLSHHDEDPSADREGASAGKTEALWRDDGVRASLALCHARGRFLFEVRPDVFPEGYLTDTEIELWARYLESMSRPWK